jgi:hypothetical protein
MNDAREGKAVALTILGAIISLACASMIGALAALVVMTVEKPVPSPALAQDAFAAGSAESRRAIFRPLRPPRQGECTVVIWNTGMIYCVRDKGDKAGQAWQGERLGPAVVVQAQADN